MLEAFILALWVLVFSVWLGINQPWIAFAMVALALPGLYAMATGAPFFPTPKKILNKMMAFANIQPGQKVYDIGCGDGRLVFAAAKQRAQAIGYEFSLPTYLLAKIRSFFHKDATIQYRNFWHQNYSDADVIFCFLLTKSMQTFHQKIWPQLKPGCKVVSHAFSIKQLKPVKQETGVMMYVKQ